jgi:hypothetical protein
VNREEEAYHELCAYTLTHGDPTFIHQHVVDAYAAQHATADAKPIKLTFALVGLYLHLERQLTGRQVQRVHMILAERKREWPTFELPASRGAMTAIQVMNAHEGSARDAAIDDWCSSVWGAYTHCKPMVIELLQKYEII